MNETKRLEAHHQKYDETNVHRLVGGVWATNENPYPVEVTVRRVPEKVVFERWVPPVSEDGSWCLSGELLANGFNLGHRVRVTVEPLE